MKTYKSDQQHKTCGFLHAAATEIVYLSIASTLLSLLCVQSDFCEMHTYLFKCSFLIVDFISVHNEKKIHCSVLCLSHKEKKKTSSCRERQIRRRHAFVTFETGSVFINTFDICYAFLQFQTKKVNGVDFNQTLRAHCDPNLVQIEITIVIINCFYINNNCILYHYVAL